MTQNDTSIKDEETEEQMSEDEIEIIDAKEPSDDNQEVSETNEEIDALKKEKDELYDRYLRVQAEYDNYKRRTEKEKVSERKYKSLDLALNFLRPAWESNKPLSKFNYNWPN